MPFEYQQLLNLYICSIPRRNPFSLWFQAHKHLFLFGEPRCGSQAFLKAVKDLIIVNFFKINKTITETWLTSTKSLVETVSIKRSKLVVPTVTNTDLSAAILFSKCQRSSGCTHQPRFGVTYKGDNGGTLGTKVADMSLVSMGESSSSFVCLGHAGENFCGSQRRNLTVNLCLHQLLLVCYLPNTLLQYLAVIMCWDVYQWNWKNDFIS